MSKHRMSFAQYAAIDAVNMSTLIEMQLSAKHYNHRKRHPKDATKAMTVGRAGHTATLEPMQFLREYVLEPTEFVNCTGQMVPLNRNLKSYKEWASEQAAAGKTVLTAEQYATAERVQDAVRSHKVAGALLRDGEREVTLRWKDPETGLDCKCRVDWLSSDIVDVKLTRHASRFSFGRQAAELGYHIRLAWYRDAVALALGDPPGWQRGVFIIAAENVEPHDVVVYSLPEAALEAGRKRYRHMLDELAECIELGHFPGVAETEVLPLELPPWALGNDGTGLGLTMGGEAISLD